MSTALTFYLHLPSMLPFIIRHLHHHPHIPPISQAIKSLNSYNIPGKRRMHKELIKSTINLTVPTYKMLLSNLLIALASQDYYKLLGISGCHVSAILIAVLKECGYFIQIQAFIFIEVESLKNAIDCLPQLFLFDLGAQLEV